LLAVPIIDNFSGTNGGGLYGWSNTINNTTIANNTADHGTHDIGGGHFTSQGGNLIGMDRDRFFINGVKGDRVGTATQRLQPIFNLTVDTLVDEMDSNFSAGDLSLREALFLLSPVARLILQAISGARSH
jgi:hypothetical protein